MRNCNNIIKEIGGDDKNKIEVKSASSIVNLEWLDSIRFREELNTKDYCINLNGRVYFYSDDFKGEKELFCVVIIDVAKLQYTKVNIN